MVIQNEVKKNNYEIDQHENNTLKIQLIFFMQNKMCYYLNCKIFVHYGTYNHLFIAAFNS